MLTILDEHGTSYHRVSASLRVRVKIRDFVRLTLLIQIWCCLEIFMGLAETYEVLTLTQSELNRIQP